MRHILITHADEPIGRRLVKTLYHDDAVEGILAVGDGRAPRTFDRFLSGKHPKLAYARLDLARHRPVSDFFRSSWFREARVESVVHVPRHGAPAADSAPIVAGLPERTAEARLVLQNCLEASSVRQLVALGSAFVYRLPPGNANRLNESSELDLDPDVCPEIRSWIDADMTFHGEIGNDRLKVSLLRLPTVVASGGYVYMNPCLSIRAGFRTRPLGFDPLCALISDKDVARAVRAALGAGRSGIFNVASDEAVPLSTLARWTRRASVPVPGPVLRWIATGSRLLGASAAAPADGPHARYGFTLDTRRAERELGFRPGYRIGLSRAGDGKLRLETSGFAS